MGKRKMSDRGSDHLYEPTSLYENIFLCRPFSKHHTSACLETGNKIIMPSSSLDRVMKSGLGFPFLFRITNPRSGSISHCGVLQFGAEEGFVYLTESMMQNLKLQEGGHVVLTPATLSKGCYVKLRPHETDFIKISDPKAVLEKNMREYSCLSKGDTIMIKHDKKRFYLDVLEVRPGQAVSLIDTDCEVEFAEPLDYKEKHVNVDNGRGLVHAAALDHDRKKEVIYKKDDYRGEEKTFRAFMGKGWRLDGKPMAGEGGEWLVAAVEVRTKIEKDVNVSGKSSEEGKDKKLWEPFTGRSYVLGVV